jgi:hypothetical protein
MIMHAAAKRNEQSARGIDILTRTTTIHLEFGETGRFECEIEAGRVAAAPAPPAPLADVRGRLRKALAAPLDFPPLEQAVIPGDKVALALDRDTPAAAELIGEIWNVLQKRDVHPDDVTVLHPAALSSRAQSDPRSLLPVELRNRVQWKVHDPTDAKACGYLAATTNGERV